MNMYGGPQFDGNSAFSGGGFMPSQASQTATAPNFSPAKNRDSQALVPLTVKQISEAFQSSDDSKNIQIDGVDVNNVKLVGIMMNKAERVTEIQFILDDGTGRIDCHRWINEAVDTKEMERVRDGMYVNVHGHLKGFQGKKQMMLYSVRPVIDHNEITYHFVDCMYAHSYNSRLRKQDAVMTPQIPSSNFSSPLKGYQAPPASQFPAHSHSMPGTTGISGLDQLVLDYLQQPSCLSRDQGVHRNEICQQLNIPLEKIQQSIESLEADGVIYSTIDASHYRSVINA